MKKLLMGLLVLTTGLTLTGCAEKGTPEDIASVADAYGRIVWTADASNVERDFYLSKVDLGDDVVISWESDNDAIEIVTETYQGQYDSEAVEYFKAKVTQTEGVVTGEVSATLSKGDAKREWVRNCRVIADRFTSVSTFEALSELANGTMVRTEVEVVSVGTVSSYGTFDAVVKFAGEETTFSVYRAGQAYHSLFVVGEKIVIESEKASYNDKAQLSSIEFVKAL